MWTCAEQALHSSGNRPAGIVQQQGERKSCKRKEGFWKISFGKIIFLFSSSRHFREEWFCSYLDLGWRHFNCAEHSKSTWEFPLTPELCSSCPDTMRSAYLRTYVWCICSSLAARTGPAGEKPILKSTKRHKYFCNKNIRSSSPLILDYMRIFPADGNSRPVCSPRPAFAGCKKALCCAVPSTPSTDRLLPLPVTCPLSTPGHS